MRQRDQEGRELDVHELADLEGGLGEAADAQEAEAKERTQERVREQAALKLMAGEAGGAHAYECASALLGHTHFVGAVASTPGGALASGSNDKHVIVWDVDGGLTQIDKFLYSTDDHIKAGALLSVGVLSCGTRNECDPALALLTEYAEGTGHAANIQMGALLGLGLAYAGSKKEEVQEALMPVVQNDDASLEVVAMAALSLGLAFAGSCNADVAQAPARPPRNRRGRGGRGGR